MQAVKWDAPKEGEGVNEYMEVLVKETVTLHKVLSRYLPSSVVEVRVSSQYGVQCQANEVVKYVMTQVFAAINHRLSEEYTKIELPSLEAKERCVLTYSYSDCGPAAADPCVHHALSGYSRTRATYRRSSRA